MCYISRYCWRTMSWHLRVSVMSDQSRLTCVQAYKRTVVAPWSSVYQIHSSLSVRPKIFYLGNYIGIIASIKYTLKLIHFHPYGYFRHHLIWHFSRFKPTLMGQGTRDRRTILIYTVAAYTWCVNTSSILFTNVIMEFDDDDTDIFDWLADIVSHGLSTC